MRFGAARAQHPLVPGASQNPRVLQNPPEGTQEHSTVSQADPSLWEPGSELRPGWQEPTCARQFGNCDCKSSAPIPAMGGATNHQALPQGARRVPRGVLRGAGHGPLLTQQPGDKTPARCCWKCSGGRARPHAPETEPSPGGALKPPAEILAPRERLLGLPLPSAALVLK